MSEILDPTISSDSEIEVIHTENDPEHGFEAKVMIQGRRAYVEEGQRRVGVWGWPQQRPDGTYVVSLFEMPNLPETLRLRCLRIARAQWCNQQDKTGFQRGDSDGVTH